MDIILSLNSNQTDYQTDPDWQEKWDAVESAIASLPADYPNRDAVIGQLKDLASGIYAGQYADKSLEDIKQMISQIEGGSPSDPKAKQINDDYEAAEQLLADILSKITNDQSLVDTLQSQIKEWQSIIAQLGPKATSPQAAKDLQAAKDQLTNLTDKLYKLQEDLQTLSQAKDELGELQALAQEVSPSDADVTKADNILATIKSQISSGTFTSIQSDFDANVPTQGQISDMQSAITALEKDVGPVTIQGQTAYIDMGCLSGMDPSMIQKIIDDLKNAGITQIDLSFAQIPDKSSWSAAISGDVVNMAHAAGMKVDLSFGGYNGAVGSNWDVGNDPAGLAKDLADFVKTNGLDGLDFDYEMDATPPNPANLLTFFESLHKDLNGAATVTLTVMGDPCHSVGPTEKGYDGGPINNLFANFSSCFDGLNLMLYGGPEWLKGHDPKNYLEMWIGNKNDPSIQNVAAQYGIPLSEIHVGFMDYANEKQGGYPGSGTDGQNAADTYKEVLSDLGYSSSDLGNTFWWPNEGYNEHSGDRYLGVIETLEKELQDFNSEMHA